MQDTLSRRIRFAPPQPMGKKTVISDTDLKVFEAIHRHGPLPSNYLHQYAQGERNNFQKRLTKLYNGTDDGTFLVRPPQQFASYYIRNQFLVYDLNDRSKKVLEEHGKLSPYINRADPFLHRLMGACVGASLELTLKEKYISRHAILSKHDKPMELPLSNFSDRKALVPDELMGVNYGGSYRFFAIEIDRNTESIERKKAGQNTFAKKLENYLDVMRNRTYKDVWGIPNLMVMTVTTNVTHMKNIMAHLKQLDPKLAERFIFRALPNFGANWTIPPVLDMSQWEGTTPFDITKP